MPAILTTEAIEKLAQGVEKAKPSDLTEIYAEIFPGAVAPAHPDVIALTQHVRSGLEPEEIVDLWNVVFPADRNIWFDEIENLIHYNEEMAEHID